MIIHDDCTQILKIIIFTNLHIYINISSYFIFKLASLGIFSGVCICSLLSPKTYYTEQFIGKRLLFGDFLLSF